MKKIIIFLLLVAIATPANASVWLIVFAKQRPVIASDQDMCVEKTAQGDLAKLPAYTTEGDCISAGETWIEQTKKGSLDRGDIGGVFEVKPDGKRMCDNYTPAVGGAWGCVEITDKTVEQAEGFLKRRLDSNLIEVEEARFYVDVPTLPSAIKDTLWNTGILHRSWDQIKPYIMDKETGEVIP